MKTNGRDALFDTGFAGDIVDTFGPFIPAEEISGLEQGEVSCAVIEGLRSSPVPFPILLDLSSRSFFSGHHILEKLTRSVIPGEFPGLGSCSDMDAALRGQDFSAPLSGTPHHSEPSGRRPRLMDDDPGGTVIERSFDILSDLLGERRNGQVEMARIVLDSFRSGRMAFIEAGTGTGKSLAYLVPAIIHSDQTGERIIISTHTKNLQNQLMTKEVPLLTTALGLDIDAVRLMGRENYICSSKLVSSVLRIAENDQAAALSLALAGALSISGTVESVSLPAADFDPRKLRAPQRCRMNSCSHSDTCPLLKARKRAREASIVFVNHALIMTDYRQGGSVIGPYECVVFDEAHHLEHTVMENLSIRVFRRDLERIVEAISPVTAAAPEWKLFQSQAVRHRGDMKIASGISALAASVDDLGNAFSSVFEGISDTIGADKRFRNSRTRYQDGDSVFWEIGDALKEYRNKHKELKETLKLLLDIDTVSEGLHLQQKLKYMEEELDDLTAALDYLVTASDDDSVFWIEWSASGNASGICGSPLSIDRRFADFIEEMCSSAILTSATLASEGVFSAVKRKLGTSMCRLDSSELIVPSPFDYENNFLIIVQHGLGDPNREDHAFDASRVVAELALRTNRRILVLFTSHSMCRKVASCLEEVDLPGPVFVQGLSGSREEVAGSFKKSKGAVLLGVASFWEGVDFPGEELEVIVIPKLPFPAPGEPIVEAMSDRLRREGEDPFGSLFLPEAIMRLRQGIGRVIRRSTDRGVAVILDSRLGSRPYSKRVLSSLPSDPVTTTGVGETVRKAAEWFTDRSGSGPR